MLALPLAAYVVIALVLGAIFGSFTTALIHRASSGVSWFSVLKSERYSACPTCGHRLHIRNLIPVVSYLAQRGRCSYCAAPIARGYFYTEISLIGLCVLYAFVQGGQHNLAVFCLTLALFPFLTALFVIDWKTKTLPNSLVLAAGITGLLRLIALYFDGISASSLFFTYGGGMVFYFVIALALCLLMSWLLKKTALGGGDIKFMAVAGLWLGLAHMPAFFMLSGLLGVGIGLAWKRIKQDPQFPFGPALIAALYALLLYPL